MFFTKIAKEKNISNLFINLEATSQPGVKSVGFNLCETAGPVAKWKQGWSGQFKRFFHSDNFLQ